MNIKKDDGFDWVFFTQRAEEAIKGMTEEELAQMEERYRSNRRKAEKYTVLEEFAADIDRRNNVTQTEKSEKQPKFFVEITDVGEDVMAVAKIISENYEYNLLTAARMLQKLPVVLACRNKKSADLLALEFSAARAAARVRMKR